MKLTKNYGLKKPEQNDFYDVVHENDNMDILDEKLNEASHYQGNLSGTYEYDMGGFIHDSEYDERVWTIQSALKTIYNAVCNLASNGVEKNKNRVDKMEQVISRASNTWIIPDYLKDAIHYVCGAGMPEENGYSADDYNDENGYGEPYLDVIEGTVYHATRIKDTPLTYGWVVKEQLTSVQDKTVYSDNGGSYVYVKSNGEVGTNMVPATDEGSPIYQKEVLQAHDDVLKKLSAIDKLAEFTGGAEQSVSVNNLQMYKKVVLALCDSSGNFVGSVTVPTGTWGALSNSIVVYGIDNTMWGRATWDGYKSVKFNRTSANTSKVILFGLN